MKTNIAYFSLALLFSVSFLSINTQAQTQLYQWVDDNGVKHFSQQPPPDALDLQPTNLNGAPVISGGEPQQFISRRSAEATDATQTATAEPPVPEKDAAKCAQAKENVSKLTDAPRIRLLDETTGEYRFVEDDERQKQLKEWQKEQSTYC